MKKNNTIRDFLVVSFGNVIALLANILVGFVLPMVLNVENYGYYKIYTLYISYIGLLHFGFVDGILLLFAGRDYEDLDREGFRLYTRFFALVECVLSVLGIIGSSLLLQGQMRIIIVLVFLNLIWTNLTLYFQYVSQATCRFKELAMRKTINAILTFCLVISLFFTWKANSESVILSCYFYITASQIISIGLLVWYITTYKEIVFGKAANFSSEKKTILRIFKKGFVLTIAYEVSRLVLVMDRQFVSILFDIDTYAKYAFAYNILSCVTALITGVSTVMFPKLKKMSREDAVAIFPKSMALVTIFVCVAQLGYYPIRHIVIWLLPKYQESLTYFRIIFPVLALTSCITIIVFTFYKILDKNNVFFAVCTISLVVAFIANVIAYILWQTPQAISWASLIATIFWYLLSVFYLSRKFQVEWKKNFIYAIIMIMVFYISTSFPQSKGISIVAYLAALLIVTFLFYKNEFRKKQYKAHKN